MDFSGPKLRELLRKVEQERLEYEIAARLTGENFNISPYNLYYLYEEGTLLSRDRTRLHSCLGDQIEPHHFAGVVTHLCLFSCANPCASGSSGDSPSIGRWHSMIDVMKMATGLSPQGRACLSETAADGCGEPSLPVQMEAHVKWQRKIFRNFG